MKETGNLVVDLREVPNAHAKLVVCGDKDLASEWGIVRVFSKSYVGEAYSNWHVSWHKTEEVALVVHGIHVGTAFRDTVTYSWTSAGTDTGWRWLAYPYLPKADFKNLRDGFDNEQMYSWCDFEAKNLPFLRL